MGVMCVKALAHNSLIMRSIQPVYFKMSTKWGFTLEVWFMNLFIALKVDMNLISIKFVGIIREGNWEAESSKQPNKPCAQ